MTIKLLHVYAQEWQHNDVHIIGNRDALKSLLDTITDALAIGMASTQQEDDPGLFASDGEGYDVRVICATSEWDSDFWRRLPLPYTKEPVPDDAISPWRVWREQWQNKASITKDTR